MNNQIPSAEVGASSMRTAVNFPFLTSESLESLIENLNFKMGLTELRYCQNFYRNERLDTPTINELKIIDRVFCDLAKSPKTQLIAAFFSNDKTVAEAYADLMARRRAVNPDYQIPCSISEMLEILPAYLGKDHGLSTRIELFSGRLRNTEASVARCKKIADVGECAAAIALRKPHPKDELEEGDAVYGILKSFNPSEDFEEKLNLLLSTKESLSYHKKTVITDGQSIITGLSTLGFGLEFNAKPFEGKDGAISPFEPLAEPDFGAITVFSKAQASDMLVAAQELELRVICLGRLTKEKKIKAASADGEALSLDLRLLKSLGFAHPKRCESDLNTPSAEESSSSVFITAGGENYRMNSAVCGGESLFMAGFNTVMHAYSLCMASGASEVIGAGVYTLPLADPTPKDLGDSVELILGAYRAQCMLGLCDVCPKIEIGEKASLCFHTLSHAPLGTPMKASTAGSDVYYLEAESKEGLPDEKNLKALYRYVTSLVGSSEISAVCPTGNHLEKSLEKMLEDAEKTELYTARVKSSKTWGALIAIPPHAIGVQGVKVAHIDTPLPAEGETDDTDTATKLLSF